MSSYFTLPSFARAKKNKEALEKTNPTEPVLKDEDEKFLTKITSQEAHAPEGAEEVAPTKITDDGKEVEVSKEDAKVEGKTGSDQVAVPETKPEEATGGAEEGTTGTEESKTGADESKTGAEEAKDTTEESKAEESVEKKAPSTEKVDESETDGDDSKQETAETAEDPPEQVPEVSAEKPQLERKKSKRNKGFELPSQEEAEAATKGFNSSEAQQAQGTDNKTAGEKRTWASYLPNVRKGAKTDAAAGEKDEKSEKKTDQSEVKDATSKEAETTDEPMSRSWVQYASSIIPPASSLPSLPSLPASWTRGKDATSEPILNEDGTINEAATKEQQEKEVSVLLDNLSLSSINNRVFSFSAESQKYYDRFTQVLKDVMTGAPTAYEDMDKLMKDAGPTLEKHFESMPPFVQTLVKSLPAKLGTTLGPELLAAASEKPGNDLRTRMEATNKSKSGGDASIEPAAAEGEKSKKKRKIPGLKGLISEQGMVASILRNIVNFLRVRFPFVIGTTNVVMSLAVFILMFVFWYCHKRGKEVRLEKEHEAAALKDGSAEGATEGAGEEEDDEIEVTDSEDEEEGEDSADALAEQIAQGVKDDTAVGSAPNESDKQDLLNKPEPAQVPLPDTEKGEKGAGLEEAKSVGV